MKTPPVQNLLRLLALVFLTTHAGAHQGGEQMAGLAKALLGVINEEQKGQIAFAFEDEERENWHFIPRKRAGLSLKSMTPQQRLLAQALLSSGLGEAGFVKAVSIMSLEEVLFQMEGKGMEGEKLAEVRSRRDPEQYFFSIFGTPGNEGSWGWRVEGHHLSLNFTIRDGRLIRATPSFFGSNPGEVREGPLSGLRVLSVEEECGRSLAKALSADQLAKAKFSDKAPKDVLTGADRKVDPLEPKGLADTEMTVGQKAMLERLIGEYLDRLRPEIAASAWQRIQESGPITFAWAGGLELGEPHYYRVQGETFLLEYDNVQNGANHVHCVWRDFEGDFGRDILAEHHKEAH